MWGGVLLAVMTVVSAVEEGCKGMVGHGPVWQTVSLRVSSENAEPCAFTQPETLALLKEAMEQAKGAAQPVKSVFLGRLMEHAWLQRHLVDTAPQDKQWLEAHAEKQPAGYAAIHLQRMLSVPYILDPINAALQPYHYRATRFSCEKVLILSASDMDLPDIPHDALCWLVLEKQS